MINVAETVKELEIYMRDLNNIDPFSELNLAIRELIDESLNAKTDKIDLIVRNCEGHGQERFGVKVDIEFAACLLID